MSKLRILIADDERPAREFLKAILREYDDVEVVAEAADGPEALEAIKQMKPDLALLDLQMPELSGLDVVKLLRKSQMPLVAFVTAFDQFAVQAFELNAVDYLLKPVEKSRLRQTIDRAAGRLEQDDWRDRETEKLSTATRTYDEISGSDLIERIPVKIREDIFLVSVNDVASIVADGELLHITTEDNRKYVINFRLKDLEGRLDPQTFIRLSRGAIANLKMISRISPVAGGTYLVTLTNGQEIASSRLQSRVLRNQILKL